MNSEIPRRSLTLAVLGGAAGIALVLSSCAGPAATSVQQPPKIPFGPTTAAASGPIDSLNWMLPQEPATLDTDIDSGATENTILANVCERLMEVQPDLSVEPRLAKSAEWVDDSHVVFTLQPGATFHDGSAITADDVVWSMKRHSAEGADESDEYKNVASIEKTGADEVTVAMKQRDAIFIQAMAGNGGTIWNPRVIEAQGEKFGTPSSPDACSGPYTITEWKPGSSLTITKAKDYWDSSRKILTGKVVFTWADQSAVVNALSSGEVQGAFLDSASEAVALKDSKSVQLAQGPSTNAWSLLTTNRGPLVNEKIRQALSLALNREGIVKAAFGGLAQPWKTPLGSGAWGYETEAFQTAYDKLKGAPAKPSSDDIAKAKQLVKDAGSPSEPIIVASDGGSTRNVISNALVDAAKKIGLKAKIITVPSQQYGDFYSDKDLRNTADLWSDEYYISKNDPVGFYKNGASTASVNFVGYNNPEYDAMVKQAQAATDDADRAELANKLQALWVAAAIWVPVAQTPNTLAMSTSVTGAPASAAYLYNPWAASVGSAKN
jgi:peptide/nickel transport system substrate-binding protein